LQVGIEGRVPVPGVVSLQVEAKVVIEDWRQDYNVLRPHSSLGGMSPDEYRRTSKGENLKESSQN